MKVYKESADTSWKWHPSYILMMSKVSLSLVSAKCIIVISFLGLMFSCNKQNKIKQNKNDKQLASTI